MACATLGQMKRLFVAGAAVALAGCAGCTGSGSPEADLPDSAALTVTAEPVEAPAPIHADSVARAPSRVPGVGSTPVQSEPALKQPPPPRDTRPSIPWPPDTITLRRDTN